MVTNFMNPLIILDVPWDFWTGLIVGTVEDTIVRSFFMYRLWRLSRRNMLLGIPSFIITATILVSGIGTAIFGLIKIPNVISLQDNAWTLYFAIACVTFSDVWFAVWLTYYIIKARKSNRTRGSSVLNTILVYTVNTGTLSSIFSVLTLIMYAKLQNTYLYMTFFLPLGKLYTNAMFATLNVRNWSHAGIDDSKVPIMTVNGNPTIPVAFTEAPPPEVRIHVDEEVIKSVADEEVIKSMADDV